MLIHGFPYSRSSQLQFLVYLIKTSISGQSINPCSHALLFICQQMLSDSNLYLSWFNDRTRTCDLPLGALTNWATLNTNIEVRDFLNVLLFWRHYRSSDYTNDQVHIVIKRKFLNRTRAETVYTDPRIIFDIRIQWSYLMERNASYLQIVFYKTTKTFLEMYIESNSAISPITYTYLMSLQVKTKNGQEWHVFIPVRLATLTD